MNAGTTPPVREETESSNAGWIAGFIVIVLVLAVGGALWFTHHPYPF